MKYRTKLTLALMLLAIISNGIATSILYFQVKKMTFNELQSKAVSIVATVASFINGENLVQFRENPTEENQYYKILRSKLIKSLNANKRKDFVVSFIYLFSKSPTNSEKIVVEVDTKTELERLQAGHPLVREQEFLKPDEIEMIGEYGVSKKFYTNQFGTWLTAFAPIMDAQGNIVGFLGTNIRGSNIISHLNELLISCLISLGFSLIAAFGLAQILVRKVSKPLDIICTTVHEIGEGNLKARSSYKTDDEFGELSKNINTMAFGLEERQRLKNNFTRYVSKDVLELILQQKDISKISHERKKITVLFSDIRSFSKLSENLPPEEVVKILNEYFQEMISIIFKYRGTLDKILGDGLMIIFGAPLDDDKQEEMALKTAVEMQAKLKELGEKWKKENRPQLSMGIGIHTGPAVTGNLGSEKHLEYTAIGKAVNLAYQIEKNTKKLNCPILVSEATLAPLKNKPQVKAMGNLTIKDKETDLKIFHLLDLEN